MDESVSLRDQFAMAALTGLLTGKDDPNIEWLSVLAYRAADMMLDERNAPVNKAWRTKPPAN